MGKALAVQTSGPEFKFPEPKQNLNADTIVYICKTVVSMAIWEVGTDTSPEAHRSRELTHVPVQAIKPPYKQ